MALVKVIYVDGETVITAENLNDIQDAIIALENAPAQGLTEDMKQALLQIARKVAYIDNQGQTYYDDLYDALYPPKTVVLITAVFNQGGTVIYDDTALDDLKQYLTVTAKYDDNTTAILADSAYTLSGLLEAGTSTVTVAYNGLTTTFTVNVTARPTLSSISADYTQSGTVYDTDTLDSLKADLVVTAAYSDSSTQTVPAADYTLSGELTVGTSTITVSYGGKTTTFSVTVTAWTAEWSYLDGGLPYVVAPSVWSDSNTSSGDIVNFVDGIGVHFKTNANGAGLFRVYPTNYQTTSSCVYEVVAKFVTMPTQNGVILRAGNGTLGMQASFGNNGLSVDNNATMVSGVSITTNTEYTFRIISNVSGNCYVYLDGQLVCTLQASNIGSKNNHILLTTGGVQMEAYVSAIRFYTA